VGQVLVRVTHNGICASDIHGWEAGPPAGDHYYFGHEPVGQIVEIGPGVAGLAPGNQVTGRLEHSMADLVVADQIDVVRLPPEVPMATALGEPLGCVVEGVRRTRIDVADRVAIVGTGFMGLCLLQVLRHSWASQIVAIDPRPDARQAALSHGADMATSPDEAESFLPFPGRPDAAFDVVFEASGTQPGLDLSTELVREHGTLSVLGYHQARRSVDMQAWNYKSLDVVNAHVRDRLRMRESVARGLQLMATGRVQTGALITHRFALDEVDRAFETLVDKPSGFIKAVIDLI
jgi:threonine dehydrogenase-like Zn-dependent dehydrogenase